MSKHLDERKVAAIIALTDGETVQAASELAKVSRQTIYDWIANDSNFQRLLNQRLVGITHIKIMRSLPHVEEAIDTIVGIMRDDNNKPSVRLQAARDVLEVTNELASYSLNQEVTAIREQLNG